MGFDYLVVPLNDEMLDYAQQSGVTLPEPALEGRLPTADELIKVVKSLPNHSITNLTELNESEGIEITIESLARVPMEPVPSLTETSAAASHLHISANMTGPNGSYRIAFHGDADVMVTILSKLSVDCGGLVFFASSDAVPWFVLPGESVPIGPEEWISGRSS